MNRRNGTENTKVALLGFGTVGRAFAAAAQDVRIAAVADTSGALVLDRPEDLAGLIAHKAAGKPLRSSQPKSSILGIPELLRRMPELGIRVLVEALPSDFKNGQPALDWLCSVLARGISAVTVDKGPLVHGFDRLLAAAASGNAKLAFQGTTGVWPSSDVRGQVVVEIEGILNGTTNFILSSMCETGVGFDASLREAQRRGIAEPDSRLDLEGWDSAAKVLILSRALMNTQADLAGISRTGIGPATQTMVRRARSTGRVVRLIARARLSSGRAQLSVAPAILGPDSPFYPVSGTTKAAIFRTAGGGQLFVSATSGLDAISEIIVEDIRSINGSQN